MGKQHKDGRNYCIMFVGYDPLQKPIMESTMPRIWFSKDLKRFETRDEQMAYFDQLDNIVAHLKDSEIMKMIIDRNKKAQKVVPQVEMIPFYQGEEDRIYFNERREIEVALEITKNNAVLPGNINNASHKTAWVDGNKHGELNDSYERF